MWTGTNRSLRTSSGSVNECSFLSYFAVIHFTSSSTIVGTGTAVSAGKCSNGDGAAGHGGAITRFLFLTACLLFVFTPAGAATTPLEKAVADLVAVTTHSYVYGFVNGVQYERDHTLAILRNFKDKCPTPGLFENSVEAWSAETCTIALSNALVSVAIQTDPLFIWPEAQVPPPPPPPTSCPATLSTTYFYSGAPESNWTIQVTASCPWTASADVPWLVLTPTADSLGIRVLDNTGPFRTGHLTVNGVIYDVSQEGL